MPVIPAIRDYIELLNNVYDTCSGDIKLQQIIVQTFFYLIGSLKYIIVYLFSFQWIRDFSYLPILVPQITHSIVKETYFLENPISHFFNFLEISPFNTNKFLIGFLNSFFLCLPISASHFLFVRRLLVQGIPSAVASGLGLILGQSIFVISVIFGLRFFIIPWFGFNYLSYIVGLCLIAKIIHDMIYELNLNYISKRNYNKLLEIGLLNFLLAWTEQSCIFQYLGNITFSAEPTVLEAFPATSELESLIIHLSYSLGLVLGSLVFITFFGFFYYRLNLFLLSFTSMLYSQWIKIINYVLICLLICFACTSSSFYGADLLIANPFGFISQDKTLQDTFLSPIFVKDFPSLNQSSFGFFNNEMVPFDDAEYLDGKTEFLDNYEDLNFEGENAWNNLLQYSPEYGVTDRLKNLISKIFGRKTGREALKSAHSNKPKSVIVKRDIKTINKAEIGENEQNLLSSYSDSNLNSDSESDSDSKSNSDSESDSNSDLNSDSESDSDLNSDSESDLDENLNKNLKLNSNLILDEDLELDVDSDLDEDLDENLYLDLDEDLLVFEDPEDADLISPEVEYYMNQRYKPLEKLPETSLLETETLIDYYDAVALDQEGKLYSDSYLKTKEKFKNKFYSNPIFKLFLNSDIDTFLSFQPKHQFLSSNDEQNLFQKRLQLAAYYDSLREYTQMPYFKMFYYLNHGSKSYADRIYNQQYKGTLRIVRRLFSITLNPEANLDKNRVLKYDQPLYKTAQQNPIIHEELSNLPFDKNKQINENTDNKGNQTLSERPPFFELTNSTPFYAGWDEQLRKLVVTNRYLSNALTTYELKVPVNLKNNEYPTLTKMLSSKKRLEFTAWPLPKSLLEDDKENDQENDQENSTLPYLLLFDHVYPEFEENVNELLPDEWKVKKVPHIFRLWFKKPDWVSYTRGGFFWPGNSPLKFSFQKILDNKWPRPNFLKK